MFNSTKTKKQTPLEIVQEIHRKVLTSGEDCLKEANLILQSKETENLELFEEMKKRGFGNSKEIKEKEAEIQLQLQARTKANLINEYAIRYPHKKFISTEEMDKICSEYKLLLGADQHYTGSIPVRSMKEIVDFKLNEIDEIYYVGRWRATEALQMDKTRGVIEWREISKDDYNTSTKNRSILVQDSKRTHYISNKDYFMIAAPESMFQIEGLVKEGNQLKQIVEVDDPICLQPVRFGFIVVAVWGEEIAIEKMQNPKMN